jgi:class 3 adenylate cyclase
MTPEQVAHLNGRAMFHARWLQIQLWGGTDPAPLAADLEAAEEETVSIAFGLQQAEAQGAAGADALERAFVRLLRVLDQAHARLDQFS